MLSKIIRGLIFLCLAATSVSFPLFASEQAAKQAVRMSEDTLLLRFTPGVKAEDKRAAHGLAKGSVSESFDRFGIELVSVPKGTVKAAIKMYNSNPNVEFAEPNYIRFQYLPDEGTEPGLNIANNFTEQYGLHNTGQSFGATLDELGNLIVPVYTGSAGADINAPEAWDLLTGFPYGLPPVGVAVLDSGVDCSHLTFSNQCEEKISYVADNGSGPDDVIGHGTHVAGIIGSHIDDGKGIAGVAPNARIGAFKVCWEDEFFLSLGVYVGACEDADVLAAMNYILSTQDPANPATPFYKVINMSLAGTEWSDSLNTAMDAAWNAGIVIVASAGNAYTKSPNYPAAYPSVISVAATDYHDNLASYSTFDKNWVDVLAPGTFIFSSVPGTLCGQAAEEPGDCYDWKSGTSMAAPHVAGLAVILASEGHSNSEIRTIIENSAAETGALGQNFLAWTIHGRIDMLAALSYTGEPPEPPEPPVAVTVSVQNILLDTVNAGKGNKHGQAQVTLVDDLGDPVSGATVTGEFTIDYNDIVAGDTGANGVATLTTETTQKGGITFGFCVTGVAADGLNWTGTPGTVCASFP